jgi:hypothetical protein
MEPIVSRAVHEGEFIDGALIRRDTAMRYLLLWVLGVPIPILILIWLLFGGH